MSVQKPFISPNVGGVNIGTAPVYTAISGKLAIDVVDDGGSGLIGYKFLAGAPCLQRQSIRIYC